MKESHASVVPFKYFYLRSISLPRSRNYFLFSIAIEIGRGKCHAAAKILIKSPEPAKELRLSPNCIVGKNSYIGSPIALRSHNNIVFTVAINITGCKCHAAAEIFVVDKIFREELAAAVEYS